MAIISISLNGGLLRRLEAYMDKVGYSSRSEAVRDALRNFLSEYEMPVYKEGDVTATVTVISDQDRRDLDERLTRLRHENDEIVSSNMHIHIDGIYCLEIYVTKGPVKKVMNFIARIRAMRGVQDVKYTMAPLIERR